MGRHAKRGSEAAFIGFSSGASEKTEALPGFARLTSHVHGTPQLVFDKPPLVLLETLDWLVVPATMNCARYPLRDGILAIRKYVHEPPVSRSRKISASKQFLQSATNILPLGEFERYT